MANLLFPRICLHCHEKTAQLFCSSCSCFFEFLPKTGRFSACFANIDAVSTFVQSLRHCEKSQKVAVAFLIIQFEKLQWPLPELVTSVPKRHPFSSAISATLAKQFARKMQLPYKSLAKRAFGELPHEESPTFFLKRRTAAKQILIIDDYMDRGVTLKGLARLLRNQLHATVYGLTLSRKRLL